MIRSLARISTAVLVGCSLIASSSASSADKKFQSSEEWPVSSEDAILNVMLEQLQQKANTDAKQEFNEFSAVKQSNTADDFSGAQQALDTSNDLLSEYAAQLFATGATPSPTPSACASLPVVSVSSEPAFATVVNNIATGEVQIVLNSVPSSVSPTPVPIYLPFDAGTGKGLQEITSVTVFPGCGNPSCEVPSYNTDFVCVSTKSCGIVSSQGYITLLVPPMLGGQYPYRSTMVLRNVAGCSFAYYLDVVLPSNLIPRVNFFNTTAMYYPLTTFSISPNSTLDFARRRVTSYVTASISGGAPALVPLYAPFTTNTNTINATIMTMCATPLCLSAASTEYACVDGASCAIIARYNYFTVAAGTQTTSDIYNSLTLGSSSGWIHTYIIRLTSATTPAPVTIGSNCYVDNTPADNRVLSTKLYSGSLNTKAYCQSLAASGRYNYYGLEFGNECWVGNTFNVNNPTTDGCSFACANSPSTMCGGFNAIQVYAVNQ